MPEQKACSLEQAFSFALMAQRNDSFEQIQRQPCFSPFTSFTSEQLIQLATAWDVGSEIGFGLEWDSMFAPAKLASKSPSKPINVRGGTGDSEEEAIVFANVGDIAARVTAEYWFLYFTHGREWEKGNVYTTEKYDVIEVLLGNGTEKEVFFDRRIDIRQ